MSLLYLSIIGPIQHPDLFILRCQILNSSCIWLLTSTPAQTVASTFHWSIPLLTLQNKSHYSWSQSSLTPGSLSAHDDAFCFIGKIEAFDRKPPQPSTPSISKQAVFLHRLPGEMLQCNCHWLNLRPKLTHHPSFPHSKASLALSPSNPRSSSFYNVTGSRTSGCKYVFIYLFF